MRPQARLDLLEIWHYIAPKSLENADRVIAEIEAAIRDLRIMPDKRHRRADVRNPKYRFWSVYSYIVAYHFDDATITVERVVHGSRNFLSLFKK